ncbi:glycoside hydrolase [Flavobacteriales bacterium]|nr:glycoside hydrolase [Flavobacteriales bacterium]|tara:strand:- start:1983 stop:3320 length:1338 start_codon:yes stop_codon:yes gene_type:complete
MLKHLILFICIFLFINETKGQAIQFDQHLTVSENSDGFGRPRLKLTNGDTPLIIWRKDATPKTLRASSWDGLSFSQPYDILQNGILPSSWDGPEVATKGDTVYVVFTSLATTQSSIMLIKSFDGGINFSDTIRVSENNPLHKFRMGNVEINNNGNPVVSYMQYLLNWNEPKQMVNTSLSFGSTFLGATEASALALGEPCDCCKSSLVCDGNNVFLLFRNNESNIRNSYIAKSTDGGLNFSSVADMDDYIWSLSSCPATTPRGVLSGDSIVVVKRSGATGNNEVVCSNVSMQNLNYSYNNNIDFISGVVQNYPEVSASGDTIIAVWQDNREGYQGCYMSFSTEGPHALQGSLSFTDTSFFGQKIDPDVEFKNGIAHLVYLNSTEHKIVYLKASFKSLSSSNEHFYQNTLRKTRKIDVLGRKTEINSGFQIVVDEKGSVKKRIILKN